MIYLVKMFRLCSDCSEFSVNVQTFQTFSVNVQTFQTMFSPCSEFVVNVQNLFRLFQNF